MHFWVISSIFLILQAAFGFIWTPAVALVLFVMFAIWAPWVLKGWTLGLKGALVIGLLVNLSLFFTAVFHKQPKLIFVALANTFIWYVFSVWFFKQVSRSFMGTGRAWFQGQPVEIPGLICEVPDVGTFKTARFDREGALLITQDRELQQKLKKTEPKTLYFQFQNVTMTCSGKWSKINLDKMGLGVRFLDMTPDRQKELGDFFEKIKGAGHESAGI